MPSDVEELIVPSFPHSRISEAAPPLTSLHFPFPTAPSSTISPRNCSKPQSRPVPIFKHLTTMADTVIKHEEAENAG